MSTEAKLEAKCKRYAERKGCLLYKWTGHRGVPDRLLVVPGKIIPIEFKAPLGKVSAQQVLIHDRLRKLGIKCIVCRSYDRFCEIVDAHTS